MEIEHFLRREWVRAAVDAAQASFGIERDDGGPLFQTVEWFVDRVPPAATPLEDMLLRGMIARLVLGSMAQSGWIAPSFLLFFDPSKQSGNDRGKPDASLIHPKVDLALRVIAKDCERSELCLQDVARQVHISPWHLSRLLKRDTGAGFNTHRTRARLYRAARLLESPTKSVKEIAAEVGYRWARDFSRDFARHFGVPPVKWRQITHGVPRWGDGL